LNVRLQRHKIRTFESLLNDVPFEIETDRDELPYVSSSSFYEIVSRSVKQDRHFLSQSRENLN